MRRLRRLPGIWSPAPPPSGGEVEEPSGDHSAAKRALFAQVMAAAADEANSEFFADLLAALLPRFAEFRWGVETPFRRNFDRFQRAGFSLLSTHAPTPIPNVFQLPPGALQRSYDFGLRDEAEEIRRVTEVARYAHELENVGIGHAEADFQFYFQNYVLEAVDAEILYGMVRYLKPKRIVSIGVGMATLLASDAARRNALEGHPVKFEIYEDVPNHLPASSVAAVTAVHKASIFDVPRAAIADLGKNDMLLAETDHVVKPGSSAEQVLFNVLPSLGRGAYAHFHPIFLPRPYPASWVCEEHVFWNEQYLLATFMMFNSDFETFIATNALHRSDPETFKRSFDRYRPGETDPGSFWVRRRP